jgi:hypothetical protein
VAWREERMNTDEKQFGIYPPLPRRCSSEYRAMMDNKGVIPLAGVKYQDDHPYLKGMKPGGPTGESPSRARSKTPKAEDKKAASTRKRSKTPKIIEKKATTTSASSTTMRPVGKETATTAKTPITTTTAEKKKEGIAYDVSLEEDREDTSSPSIVTPKDKIGERITIEMITQEKDEEKKKKLMRRMEMQTLQDRIAYARIHGRYPSPERRRKREVKDDKKKQEEKAASSSKRDEKETKPSRDPKKQKHRHHDEEKQKHGNAKEETRKKEDEQKSRGKDYKKPSH